MPSQKRQVCFRPAVFIIVVVLAAFVVLSFACRKSAENGTNAENKAAEPAKADAAPAVSKPTLKDVISSATFWLPAFTSWYGRPAPDFTITDVTGKTHKLSDYHGKDVLLVFWATWCGPCKRELPHLIALRNIVSEDKLAILAISYITPRPPETPEKVNAFVSRNKINYTVFSVDPAVMPLPYNQVTSIPCSFFIDAQGRVKLAAEGVLLLGDIKAILQAEQP
jgi:peroxiredoxin